MKHLFDVLAYVGGVVFALGTLAVWLFFGFLFFAGWQADRMERNLSALNEEDEIREQLMLREQYEEANETSTNPMNRDLIRDWETNVLKRNLNRRISHGR